MIKIFLIIGHLLYGFFYFFHVLYINEKSKNKFIKSWSKKLLKILKVNLIVNSNLKKILSENNYLIVSNHISWLDIFLINSIYPVTFLSKSSVSMWPFIGSLTKSANTIYIDREKIRAIKGAKIKIEYYLKNEGSVYFFPEGTATDGSYILPFKSNFFQAAINAKVNILPITIKYSYRNKFTSAPSYFDDMSLFKSIFNLTKFNNIEAKLIVLPNIKFTSDRKKLASKAYIEIGKVLN